MIKRKMMLLDLAYAMNEEFDYTSKHISKTLALYCAEGRRLNKRATLLCNHYGISLANPSVIEDYV